MYKNIILLSLLTICAGSSIYAVDSPESRIIPTQQIYFMGYKYKLETRNGNSVLTRYSSRRRFSLVDDAFGEDGSVVIPIGGELIDFSLYVNIPNLVIVKNVRTNQSVSIHYGSGEIVEQI